MAAINNSINLQDRMTPVLRSVMKSMDSTLRVMRNLDRQANQGVQSKAYRTAEKDIKRANNELIRMQNNLLKSDQAAGQLAKTTGRVSANVTAMGTGGLNLANLAAGLYLIRNIADAVQSIMEIPDSMQAIQYRLDTYDTTDATGVELFDAAFESAQKSRSDLGSTANLASRILVSGATDGNGAAAIKLAETFNKASFLGGSSADESARALLQLSQALASGVLQGDELRAIREQAPGLTDTMARGLSELAAQGELPEHFKDIGAGDLKELGAMGELTAQRVIAAFRQMEGYVDDTFAKSPKQFGQAMAGIANVWKRWLKMMSDGDNALARINEKVWQLLNWLESPGGTRFLNSLATGINIVVNALIQCTDWLGQLVTAFQSSEQSANALQAVLTALAIVGGAAAIYLTAKWVAAWIAAAWPVLLVIALLAIVIYVLLECGATAGDIVGAIAGFFIFLGFILQDIVVGALLLIISVIIGLGMITNVVAIGIMQIILWVVTTVWGAFVTLYNVLYSIIKGAWGFIKAGIVGVYEIFVWMGQGVLGVLYNIAEAMDFVFGSNMAESIGGWMDGLDASVDALNEALDPFGEFDDIGNQWKDSYNDLEAMYKGEGKYDDWNILDNAQENWQTGEQMLKGIWDFGSDYLVNPMDGWDEGKQFGYTVTDYFKELEFDSALGDLSRVEEEWKKGLDINGGNIDSVGEIKSDVDISEQDIQLLRDISAREFLLNLQTVTPQANISFGDVKETADVNKIMEVIQDMVDEEMATSLVVD